MLEIIIRACKIDGTITEIYRGAARRIIRSARDEWRVR